MEIWQILVSIWLAFSLGAIFGIWLGYSAKTAPEQLPHESEAEMWERVDKSAMSKKILNGDISL